MTAPIPERISTGSLDPDPSPWSVDYTEPPSDTVLKLKSFIRQNLRNSSDSFQSNGSSDDNLSEVELTTDQQRMYHQYNELTSRRQAEPVEPKPLTTTNVTLHDQIWSSDLGNTSQNSDAKCRKLLRSSNEDLAEDRSSANRKARMYPDSGSERSCDSQDTMILTVTDNQSHTYAFHNRLSARGRAPGENADLTQHDVIDIPSETDSDCIPIRRGSSLPEDKVGSFAFIYSQKLGNSGSGGSRLIRKNNIK